MLSIKSVSESASAERLAQQVQEEHATFFEEQEAFAMKDLTQDGLVLIRGDAEEVAEGNICINTIDADGGCFRLPLRRDDEVRDRSGFCIGCRLPLISSKKANCYLGCRNTAARLYPAENQSVPLLHMLTGKTWVLTKTPRGNFLTLLDPEDPPKKLKPASPKVIGILKR